MLSELKSWEYEGVSVGYFEHLDGDGRSMAEAFVEMLKANFSDRIPFDCCYEWCSGPGFIGFAVLAAGLCKRLVLADINIEAVKLAKQTVINNGLENQVTVYHSDNLKSIPKDEMFDLVVSNPPNYYCLNPQHPSYARLAGDLRPNDPEWSIHRDFYAHIANHLNEDAVLCIEEVDPFASKCFMPNAGENSPLWGPEPFDIRPREPILDFREMIAQGGLCFDQTIILPHSDVPIHVLVSHYSETFKTSNIRLRPGLLFLEQVGELDNGSFRLYASENNQLRGFVDLPDAQLWLVSMIEILTNVGDEGISIQDLCSRLDLIKQDVESAHEMMRSMAWTL